MSTNINNILEIRDLEQTFRLTKGLLDEVKFKDGKLVRDRVIVKAVNGISFDVKSGSVVSLVGESGCGKSTTARTIIKLIDPKSGSIRFEGNDITGYKREQMLPVRKEMQMIFQDPYASLNPRSRIIDIIAEPMLFHKLVDSMKEARERATELLRRVGIRPEQISRYPHQFSGGQRQRIGIARALSVNPKFIIADEPVSALDVSIQAQILNLMMDLQEEFGFSYLFIAHNLSVVKHISDTVGIMYLGKIVEMGPKSRVFANPQHPYTRALLDSIPKISGDNLEKTKPIKGEIPSPINLPSGCFFHERCPRVMPVCRERFPAQTFADDRHFAYCHLLS
jgi:oligopeptide/dipeptide ABC transporter ATP-binding protein